MCVVPDAAVNQPCDDPCPIALTDIVGDLILINQFCFLDAEELLQFGTTSSWSISVLFNAAQAFSEFRPGLINNVS